MSAEFSEKAGAQFGLRAKFEADALGGARPGRQAAFVPACTGPSRGNPGRAATESSRAQIATRVLVMPRFKTHCQFCFIIFPYHVIAHRRASRAWSNSGVFPGSLDSREKIMQSLRVVLIATHSNSARPFQICSAPQVIRQSRRLPKFVRASDPTSCKHSQSRARRRAARQSARSRAPRQLPAMFCKFRGRPRTQNESVFNSISAKRTSLRAPRRSRYKRHGSRSGECAPYRSAYLVNRRVRHQAISIFLAALLYRDKDPSYVQSSFAKTWKDLGADASCSLPVKMGLLPDEIVRSTTREAASLTEISVRCQANSVVTISNHSRHQHKM